MSKDQILNTFTGAHSVTNLSLFHGYDCTPDYLIDLVTSNPQLTELDLNGGGFPVGQFCIKTAQFAKTHRECKVIINGNELN
jgi:hypothetical protein